MAPEACGVKPWRLGWERLGSSTMACPALGSGYEDSMARVGRNYAQLWRQGTWPLRLQMLMDLILPVACVVLFFLGDTVAGVSLACAILLNSAIVWPMIRYRHARQRTESTRDQ
jgi:hypothetical protein